ncbi:sodium:hydrogen antiporter [Flavobacterium rivuli WB 3.3-2 = DSM 21788]|uniref:Sodium:hydrogen antiporter n=1 Tax=Flavobacterium rivuli WB 3.3-2 = DSM 21788 TaxID=1121895 RepID=A0A0A2MHZ7_9FLAO|nr:Na+/H+ antiporter [Flavobacterium rivuli]KGO87945.1 sodium:hydrogen antiporter [Flavobacterium rivuli WB 3.3-2 = DSM 21788]
MQNSLLIILALLFVVMMLVLLAQRLKIAYPIFLVVAGLGISFIPGIPHIGLNPEIIFLIFLPPLLYEAAWYTSWKDFWHWKRPIALYAFGLVFATSIIVAYASVALIPGFTLALGFLLGGIVSPPDAVAASTVLKGVKVPRRVIAILEGESLVNDASSLIVFRFALAAVITGAFSLQVAVGNFFLAAGMGLVTGVAIGHVMYVVHRFLPTTAAMDTALTLMAPYIIYLTAEHFDFSGVIAVVSGGLFISYRSHEIFTTGETRLNMMSVWRTLVFIMNAIVFILIGLELPTIINGLGEHSINEALGYGLIISAVTIAVRFAWVFASTHLARLNKKIRINEPNPGWKFPLVVGWAGMRGVVSLATALSVPVLMVNNEHFPFRSLIIFITFVVIFITLVIQGLTLPLLIKLIDIKDIDGELPPEQQQASLKLELDDVALKILDEKYSSETQSNELLGIFKDHLLNDVNATQQRLECLEFGDTKKHEIDLYNKVLNEIYTQQRKELSKLRRNKSYSDEEIRRMDMQIDLEELKISGGHIH